MGGKLKVMLTTEGTYPFHQGGVSTWCHVLAHNLKDVEYTIFSVMMHPYVTQKFSLPENAKLIRVPLWGTEDASEHLEVPFSRIYLAKNATTDEIVSHTFLPLFLELIEEIISLDKNPAHFAAVLHKLYRFCLKFDYTNSFKSQLVWDVFKEHILSAAGNQRNKLPWPSVFELIQSLGWVFRFFTILNTPLPEVDVVHSAAAAFCGIPGVVAKLEKKTPYLLTEHGVYLREQYLSIARINYSSYLRTFLIRLVHSISTVSYYAADQVSPVCQYNMRWEEQFGVTRDKIKVIYNGVDRHIYAPSENPVANKVPTVVTVARVDPVKDLKTLIKSASIVKAAMPEVKFFIYGSISVPAYYDECQALCAELDMQQTVIFAGHTEDVPGVLRTGDVIALSSITEAFPYSVVEAMMAGKPIVATDVGGVKEALGDCGLVVPPGRPDELGQALISLLSDTELRLTLGEEAHKRALNNFTLESSTDSYFKAYCKLVAGSAPEDEIGRQKMFVEQGYALAAQIT